MCCLLHQCLLYLINIDCIRERRQQHRLYINLHNFSVHIHFYFSGTPPPFPFPPPLPLFFPLRREKVIIQTRPESCQTLFTELKEDIQSIKSKIQKQDREMFTCLICKEVMSEQQACNIALLSQCRLLPQLHREVARGFPSLSGVSQH